MLPFSYLFLAHPCRTPAERDELLRRRLANDINNPKSSTQRLKELGYERPARRPKGSARRKKEPGQRRPVSLKYVPLYETLYGQLLNHYERKVHISPDGQREDTFRLRKILDAAGNVIGSSFDVCVVVFTVLTILFGSSLYVKEPLWWRVPPAQPRIGIMLWADGRSFPCKKRSRPPPHLSGVYTFLGIYNTQNEALVCRLLNVGRPHKTRPNLLVANAFFS